MSFDLRKLQLKELEILKEIDRICKKHHIEYVLAYGTALGAVRHQGFIPWDDDIDIMMKAADLARFKEVCKTELNEHYFFQDFETDPYLHCTWAKIRENGTTSMIREMSDYPVHWGICIDIFPMIHVRSSGFTRLDRFAYKLMNLCANKKLNEWGYGSYGLKTNKAKWIPEFLVKPLYQKARAYLVRERKNADCYYDFCTGLDARYRWEDQVFADVIELPFEDGTFPVVREYDAYLTISYGADYMEIPKVEDRVDHGDIIVDFDKDYKEYMTKRTS